MFSFLPAEHQYGHLQEDIMYAHFQAATNYHLYIKLAIIWGQGVRFF